MQHTWLDRAPNDVEGLQKFHDAHVLPLSHWNKPRMRIAPATQGNDMFYTLSGVQTAAKIIKGLNLLPYILSEFRVLDYGCGTGKVARALRPFVKHVVCFDPNGECLRAAKEETVKSPLRHDWSFEFTSQVPESRLFELIVCNDVLPILSMADIERVCRYFTGVCRGWVVANCYNYQFEVVTEVFSRHGVCWQGVVKPGQLANGDHKAITMHAWHLLSMGGVTKSK